MGREMAGQGSNRVMSTHDKAKQGTETQGGCRADDMESLDTSLETAVEPRRSHDAANRLAKTRIEKAEPVDIDLEPRTGDDMVETALAIDCHWRTGSARKSPAFSLASATEVAVSVSALPSTRSRSRQAPSGGKCLATIRVRRRLGRQCTAPGTLVSNQALGPDARPDRGDTDSPPERALAWQGGHPANLILPHDKRRVRSCLAQQAAASSADCPPPMTATD